MTGLDPAQLMANARAATGLTDFGDPWFMPAFERVVELVNAEGGLTSPDADPVLLLIGSLCDRLRLVRYLNENPKALDQQVEVAAFIIGWPRGGSTLLHRLLCSSPQLTGACWWELLNPLPLTTDLSDDREARKQLAVDTMNAMYAKWPKMKSQHPLKPFDVDEEVMLFDRTFMSLMWQAYFYIPSYMGWLGEQDQRRAYEEMLLWLKVIAFQRPNNECRKWVLKSPQHLLCGGLRFAFEAMPQAKAIITHRTLQKVATSYASMIDTTISQWSTTYDPKRYGRDAIGLFERSVAHLAEVRGEARYADRFIDVRFEDTFERPIEVFTNSMKSLGLKAGESDLSAARGWMAANGRETHPPHSYAPEDYGMNAEQIDAAFAEYHAAYL
jgi:hypothetical protein